MNLPTLFTLLRIFFVPLLIAALVQETLHVEIAGVIITNEILALAIFLVAAATDLVDGWLARRWGQVTTVGTLLDPIADKLLISAALISLVQIGLMPGWMAVIIIGREFAVTGLRGMMLSEHWASLRPVAIWWLWGVVLFALISAADYFRNFWRRVDESIKRRRRRELLLLARQQRREMKRQRRAAR